jgi:hypothetical protein
MFRRYFAVLALLVASISIAVGLDNPSPTYQNLVVLGLSTLTGGVLGVTDGSTSAAAGNIGERKNCDVAFGSAIALNVGGTPVNVCSIAITAGAWKCYGNHQVYLASNSPQVFFLSAWLTTSSATEPANDETAGTYTWEPANAFQGNTEQNGWNVGPVPFDTSLGETVYLVGAAGGLGSWGSNVKQFGAAYCERWR